MRNKGGNIFSSHAHSVRVGSESDRNRASNAWIIARSGYFGGSRVMVQGFTDRQSSMVVSHWLFIGFCHCALSLSFLCIACGAFCICVLCDLCVFFVLWVCIVVLRMADGSTSKRSRCLEPVPVLAFALRKMTKVVLLREIEVRA